MQSDVHHKDFLNVEKSESQCIRFDERVLKLSSSGCLKRGVSRRDGLIDWPTSLT